MIRRLMASSAVIALVSAGALTMAQAQTNSTDQSTMTVEQPAAVVPPATDAAGASAGTSTKVLTPDEPTLASVFIGRSVYSGEGDDADNIGDVNDLIVAKNGDITDAVIGVGGFLGIGEKEVAVPFDQLKVEQKEGDVRLIYSATKEQLEAAPAFDRTAYDPIARYDQQQAAANTSAPGLMPAGAPPANGDMTAAPAAPTTDATAANGMAADQALPADQADNQAATSDNAAPTVASSSDVKFMTPDAQQIRATTLIGQAIYGPDDANIGKVSDLVFEKEGNTRAALIDVGGFLGIGTKTVAIGFKDLSFVPTDNGTMKVSVAMTKDQLEQLPTFEPKARLATTAPATDAVPANDNMTATGAAPTNADTTAATDLPANAPADTQPADQTAANENGQPAVAGSDALTRGDAMTTGSIDGQDAYSVASQDIPASSLIGANVYGPEDASIGSIDDVVFNKDGQIDGVIVNVGGFLGLGAKPVAVSFDALNVRSDENGTLTVMVDASKDQLESAPTYDEKNAAALQ